MTDPQFWEWYWKVLLAVVIMGPWVVFCAALFIADHQIEKYFEKKSQEL